MEFFSKRFGKKMISQKKSHIFFKGNMFVNKTHFTFILAR